MKPKIILGKDIAKKFDIPVDTLFRYIQLGLPVYNDKMERINASNYFVTNQTLQKELYSTSESSRILRALIPAISKGCADAIGVKTDGESPPALIFDSPFGEEAEMTAYAKLMNLWFIINEVERFIEKHERVNMKPNIKVEGKLPPYLDENHIYFSRELKAAIDAWTALFDKGEYDDRKSSAKTQIQNWLNKKFPNEKDFSTNAKERISTLVNPNIKKKGGAPKL